MGGAKHEARELAFQTWRECGQNLSECERLLNRDKGLPVSRQTLTEWCKKYNWEARAARAEALEIRKAEAFSDDAILSALLDQKERYEQYFDSLQMGVIDNQALFAYSGLLKNLLALKTAAEAKTQNQVQEVDRPKLFLENLSFLAEVLKEIDPEGLKILGRSFETIVGRFKAQHATAA